MGFLGGGEVESRQGFWLHVVCKVLRLTTGFRFCFSCSPVFQAEAGESADGRVNALSDVGQFKQGALPFNHHLCVRGENKVEEND